MLLWWCWLQRLSVMSGLVVSLWTIMNVVMKEFPPSGLGGSLLFL